MKQKNKFRAVLRDVIGENRGLATGMVLLILCSVIFALLPPLVLEKIINTLTDSQNVTWGLVFLYFGVFAASGFFDTIQNAVITVFGQKVTHGLRKEMCEKLSRLPSSYFTVHESGKITSRFVNDVDAVDTLFSSGIISMFVDTCKVVSIIGVIFWKSMGLGMLMLLITPLLFVLTRVFQKRMLQAQVDNRKAVGKVNNHIPETIRNIRMIHTLFREKYMEQRYDDYIQESYRAVEKSNIYDSVYSPIIIFVSSCVIAVMMVLSAMGGGMQTFFGMSVGTAVAVITYVGKVFKPLESIGMEIQNIQSAVAGVRRIKEFLEETEDRKLAAECMGIGYTETGCSDAGAEKNKENMQQDVKNGEIRFEHVRFGYDSQKTVLDDLSFTLQAGESATLMGRTGAGKSTVLRLLLGLYHPQEGRITVGGISPESIPDKKKRSVFGYVEQSFKLMSGTVAEQISLFDTSISRAQIEKAARLVGLHENIIELEQGYNTFVTENMFSQGQFQLLSIARAVVAEPEILLLDEITANLDSDTEHRVMEALENACENRTVLSVSHRLYERNMGGKLIAI